MRRLRKYWRSFRRTALQKADDLEFKLRGLVGKSYDYSKMGASEFAEKILKMKPFPYQKALLEDSSKRLVACMGRQSGKTTTIAMRAINFAFINSGVTVLITAPSLRQSMIMFDRISMFIFSTALLKNKVIRSTRTIIQLDNRSQIIALPCSEYFLRGYTAHMIICDEASFMPEELITNVLFPMISTTDGYAIFLSTPWGKDHFFYRAFMDPNYSVHRVKSSECPLIKPEFLEEMQRNMTEQAFRMEYMAEFVEALNSYFPQDLIRGCVDPTLEFILSLETQIPSGEYYAGVDFGKLQDYSVIAILKREGDLLNLIYLYEFPIGTPYTKVIGHLTRADKKFRFHKVLVDQTGVGEPVLEELKEQGMQNVEGLVFTVRTKEEMMSCLKIAMEQKRLRMPYHRRLAEQINEQQYEYSKSGHLKFSHPENSHDDMLWSLALSCYVATLRRQPPSRLVRAY